MTAHRTIRQIVEEAILSGGSDRDALRAVKAEMPDVATGLPYIRTIRKRMPHGVGGDLQSGNGSGVGGMSVGPAAPVSSGAATGDASSDRYDDYAEAEADDFPIDEYDINSVPSDFTVMTLKELIDRRWVLIPGFQRHFVWDLRRSSKLIESLILGLPVPQLFLYEQEQNRNLLIDGQQRLMSVYYYLRERFPRKEKRGHLRRMFNESSGNSDELLKENEYFQDFKLRLPTPLPNRRNRLHGKTYSALREDDKSRLDMRPIRCITVRQNAPGADDSSMYEIFNRLNTGGVNLHPQEIRSSMYHSNFYDMLTRINEIPGWRRILGADEPDLNMRDVEILLRGFAMLVDGDAYKPSMAKFLNAFSKTNKSNTRDKNEYLERIFRSFIDATENLSETIFMNKNKKFNVALFEATFAAICQPAHDNGEVVDFSLDATRIHLLREDREFVEASQSFTTRATTVRTRLDRAVDILSAE